MAVTGAQIQSQKYLLRAKATYILYIYITERERETHRERETYTAKHI